MAEKIYRQPIAEVLPKRFLEYSQSVIQDRAISDGFDGLKPVHRRILLAMHGLGLGSTSQYRKCAKTVGEVLGRYHPHGDQSAYDALVGLAQTFNMRYPLVDGSGNFGSVNGDPAAAMRYTEARLSPFGELMLEGVEKLSETKDNFDNTDTEAITLSSYFPNLLLNAQSGIAVGLAAKFAPHYAKDVYNALLAAVRKRMKGQDADLEELIEIVKAPDFPTGAEIINGEDVKNIYRTGSGPVTLRAKYKLEKDAIVYYEIPYKVTPKSIIQAIVELEIADIKDVRDETSLSGLRIVVELKKGANPDWIINKLFKDTSLQCNYSVNMTAIMGNRPVQSLNLKKIIEYYLDSLEGVHMKSLKIQLEELERKIFINNTMLKAIDFIDEIIRIVRNSDDPVSDMEKELGFTHEEAEYIYQIRLSQISKASKAELDKKKLEYAAEHTRLTGIIGDRTAFLKDLAAKLSSIRDSKLFKNDERRTEILNITAKASDDMRQYVKNEAVIISYSNHGMIKATRPDEYKTNRRNAQGVKAKNLREDEFILQSLAMDTHSDIMLFTDMGRCYILPAYKIPITGRNGAAKSINNYLTLTDGEAVIMIAKVPEDISYFYLVMVTRSGYIKRMEMETALSGRASTVGTRAISLEEGDKLCGVSICESGSDIALFTDMGRGIKFSVDEVRPMGKTARGVKAMKLKDDESVIAAATLGKEGSVLLLTTGGYGKRLAVKSFKDGKRTQAPVNYMAKISEVGRIVGAPMVLDDEDVIITTRQGQVLRLDVTSLQLSSRTAKGLKMITFKDDSDAVVSVATVAKEKEEEETTDNEQLQLF